MTVSNNAREWIIALIILSFSLLTLFYLIPTQIELTDEYALRSLSPAFYPSVSAWIIAALSVWHKMCPTLARTTKSDPCWNKPRIATTNSASAVADVILAWRAVVRIGS